MGTSYNKRVQKQQEQIVSHETGEAVTVTRTILTVPTPGLGVGKFSMYFHRSAAALGQADLSKISHRILWTLLSELVEGGEVLVDINELAEVLTVHHTYVRRGIAELVRFNILKMSRFGPVKSYRFNADFVHHGTLGRDTAELQRLHGPVRTKPIKDRTKENK